MSTTLASFDSGHGDQVHDVQLDYYGKRIATASSDRGIKIFEVAGDQVWAVEKRLVFVASDASTACLHNPPPLLAASRGTLRSIALIAASVPRKS